MHSVARNVYNRKNFLILLLVAAFTSSFAYLVPANALPHIGKKAAEGETHDAVVVIETTKGNIKCNIFKDEAPKTAANFLDLVHRGFYNGLTFHRFEDFCIQGGDPQGTGGGGFVDPKTGVERTIPLEVNPGNPRLRHNAAGVMAMARTEIPNSASSQFYFTRKPSNYLDTLGGGYAVFGKVADTASLNVVMNLRKGDKMIKVYEQEAAK